jgi:uncharacterized membrane protein
MATSTLPRPSKRARRSHRESAPPTPTWTRDRIVFGAAALGLLVSLYLLLTDLFGGSALCVAGANCDIVRASAYGRVFGLPMALLGVGYFLAVGVAAFLRTPWQSRLLELLGGVGIGSAAMFIGVQGLVLNAWCPYCLVADAAALVIGLRVFWPRGTGWHGGARRPRSAAPTPVKRGSLMRGIIGAVLAVAVLLLGYAASTPASTATADTGTASATSTGNADQLAALADHLRESGAVFYGAYWCPHCQNQKAMFGGAASRLPYVECDSRGTNGQPAACQAAGVKAYPTWVIGGQTVEGELSVSELAQRSGFILR